MAAPSFPKAAGSCSLYLTDDEKAYIKAGGKVVPLTKVEGSKELPFGAWEDYGRAAIPFRWLSLAAVSRKAKKWSTTWPVQYPR